MPQGVCVEICVLGLVLGGVTVETKNHGTPFFFVAPDLDVPNIKQARSKESAYE